MAGASVRLRRRLTVAFVLVAVVSTATLTLGAYLLVRQSRFDDSVRRAGADARYQLVLARQFLPLDAAHRASLLASFEGSGRHVVLVTAGGEVASNPAFALVPDPPVQARAAAGQLVYARDDAHRLSVGGRIPGDDAQLYVVTDEIRIHHDLGQLRTALLAGSLLVVLLAALVGRTLAGRTLEPVGRASAAAHAVAEGLLDTRLPVDSHDEFGAWAESFNRMAAALEAKIAALSAAQARERRFTADVAHELRTPVTALVAAASLLREHLDALPPDAHRPAALLVNDVVRLRHLVEDLMEVSRLDAGQEDVAMRPTDLTGMAAAIVAHRGWTDRVTMAGGPAPVSTDPRRLERILANLIANAVEHGGSGVRVEVAVHDTTATVRVTDRGPGIAAEHLPRLFDRFYKADPARGGAGSGLGLAIAAENAHLLGADLTVASEVGVGTEFHLVLPRGEVPAPEGTPRRSAALTLCLTLLAVVGCTPGRSGSLGPAPSAPASSSAPSSLASPGPSPAATGPGATGPGATITIQAWFARGGAVFPTPRTRPATVATSRLALTELVTGPTPEETAAGVTSAFPSGTSFEVKGIADGVETVDFPTAFYVGDRTANRLRQAQVVYTLTQFPTVSRVAFRSAGAPAGNPVPRAEYADLLPPIVVTAPGIGAEVPSPVTVTGTADVFEATVSLRILDAGGTELGTRFTTATCGSGCRGDYSTTLAYRSDRAQLGTLQVYEVSARDGSHVHVVDIPVRLAVRG